MKKLFYLCLLGGATALYSCSGSRHTDAPKGKVSIIPMPASVTEKQDSFLLDKHTVIVASGDADRKTAALFNAWLKELTGYELAIKDQGDRNSIVLHTGSDSTNAEGYTLNVDSKGVAINGNSGRGTFYGVQSLIQLLPVQKAEAMFIPGVSITDAPRFAYRGLHLDVGRHFFPVEFIKKYIDLLDRKSVV